MFEVKKLDEIKIKRGERKIIQIIEKKTEELDVEISSVDLDKSLFMFDDDSIIINLPVDFKKEDFVLRFKIKNEPETQQKIYFDVIEDKNENDEKINKTEEKKDFKNQNIEKPKKDNNFKLKTSTFDLKTSNNVNIMYDELFENYENYKIFWGTEDRLVLKPSKKYIEIDIVDEEIAFFSLKYSVPEIDEEGEIVFKLLQKKNQNTKQNNPKPRDENNNENINNKKKTKTVIEDDETEKEEKQEPKKNNFKNNVKESSQPKEEENEKEIPQLIPLKGDYYLAVLINNKERVSLRKNLEKNNSLLIGKYSTSKELPDIDLMDLFKKKENEKKCSRHQLKVFWKDNGIVCLNIGKYDILLNKKVLYSQDYSYLDEDDELLIGDEIIIKLVRR